MNARSALKTCCVENLQRNKGVGYSLRVPFDSVRPPSCAPLTGTGWEGSRTGNHLVVGSHSLALPFVRNHRSIGCSFGTRLRSSFCDLLCHCVEGVSKAEMPFRIDDFAGCVGRAKLCFPVWLSCSVGSEAARDSTIGEGNLLQSYPDT